MLGRVREGLLKMVMFALSCERLVGVSRQMFRQIGSGNTAKGAEGGSWRVKDWRRARGARPEGVSQEVARWEFLGGWVGGGWTALLSQAPISILPFPYPQVLATISSLLAMPLYPARTWGIQNIGEMSLSPLASHTWPHFQSLA